MTPVAVTAMLAMTAAPALAQHRGGSRGGSRVSAVGRSAPVYRGGESRSEYRGGYRGEYRGGFRGGFGAHVYVAPRTFYRQYYSFHPRFSIGFGLTIGYPVPFSSYYWNPYGYYGYYGSPYYGSYDPYYGSYYPNYGSYYPNSGYSYPPQGYAYPAPPYSDNGYGAGGYPSTGSAAPADPNSGYAPGNSGYGYGQQGGSVNVQPGTQQQESGGVSFEVTPASASVFVDGVYMGTGADFGPSSQPLGLTVGRHHVEIRAEGYKTMAFDADVTAGQVTPFQANLQRQ